ncbi:MAG TPA: DUF2202 domain-containing protein [Saprospiraceae bacterium]|nr:DUF2202 domain-containing protein [Saprospiraceae bacterium]
MKKLSFLILMMFFAQFLLVSCDKVEVTNDNNGDELTVEELTGLLHMLEEEKLARDVYIYLEYKWNLNQFRNIKNSESTHMNAIASLLDKYGVRYTILSEGEFVSSALQSLYNELTVLGGQSSADALQVGATIEDLDIVDLKEYIQATDKVDIIEVYESLECGSRNHLRAFVRGITNSGDEYIPQFMTTEEYNSILSGSHEYCNE